MRGHHHWFSLAIIQITDQSWEVCSDVPVVREDLDTQGVLLQGYSLEPSATLTVEGASGAESQDVQIS